MFLWGEVHHLPLCIAVTVKRHHRSLCNCLFKVVNTESEFSRVNRETSSFPQWSVELQSCHGDRCKDHHCDVRKLCTLCAPWICAFDRATVSLWCSFKSWSCYLCSFVIASKYRNSICFIFFSWCLEILRNGVTISALWPLSTDLTEHEQGVNGKSKPLVLVAGIDQTNWVCEGAPIHICSPCFSHPKIFLCSPAPCFCMAGAEGVAEERMGPPWEHKWMLRKRFVES